MDALLDQGVTVGGGTGALLALPLVEAAAELAADLPVEGGRCGGGAAEADGGHADGADSGADSGAVDAT
jgi:nicotinate-nucleotide--dimethylbenzimidazole phosphoribosyltransferase